MIYLIADTHFYHKNIIKYCNRPFKDVLEMNETLIKNWNDIVMPKDTIYHLGDLALASNEILEPILNRLNGNKNLIRGNHDTKSVVTYENMGFTVLRNPPITLEKQKLILSHVPLPDNQIPDGYINVHGHIHNNPLNKVTYHNVEEIIEYPKELYSIDKHICVSVDVTEYKPVSLVEIEKLRS